MLQRLFSRRRRRPFPRLDDDIHAAGAGGASGPGSAVGSAPKSAAAGTHAVRRDAPGRGADPYGTALKGLRPWLLVVIGFSTIINLLMLTGSVYMLQVYDRVLTSGSVPTLFGLFAIVFILYAFLGFYDFLRARMLGRAGLRLDQAIAAPAFRAWIASGLGKQGGAASGQDGDDAPMRDLETVRGFAASPAAAVLFDLPFVPLFVAVLFLLHPWLGWATLAGAGIAMALALIGRWLTESGLARAAALEAKPRELADRGRQNAETVLAMGMDSALQTRWSALRNAALGAAQGTGQTGEALSSGSRSFRMLLQSAILTLGAYLTLQGQITAGMIIAASILSGRALAPIDQAVGQARGIARAAAAHKRLKAFSARIADAAAEVALPEPEGRLAVDGLVHFAAARTGAAGAERKRILSEVAFDLEPGDALGVVGPSASGKSTLARLLAGARMPDGGTVRLDGATLDQYASGRLARHVGYLPQRVDLLPGTVRDNIARFAEDATDAAVIAAAQAAGVHDMILALPEGYATEIEPGQSLLSGGQVQRIGLARALYGDPVLVVLDEPNSHLDAAGDAALTRAVERLRSRGAAVVIMAHRPSALAAVNKMMVLERGRIAAFGDKSEVLDLISPAPERTVPAPAPVPASVPSGGRTPAPGSSNAPANALADAPAAGGIRFRQQNAQIRVVSQSRIRPATSADPAPHAEKVDAAAQDAAAAGKVATAPAQKVSAPAPVVPVPSRAAPPASAAADPAAPAMANANRPRPPAAQPASAKPAAPGASAVAQAPGSNASTRPSPPAGPPGTSKPPRAALTPKPAPPPPPSAGPTLAGDTAARPIPAALRRKVTSRMDATAKRSAQL